MEIVSLLTDDGVVPLEQVELGIRFEREDKSVDWKRRNVIYHNAAELRQDFTKRGHLSLEVGMILSNDCVPAEFEHVGLQAWRDFFSKRVDEFAVMKPLVFDWDIDVEKRAVWNTHKKCRCSEKQVCSFCWAAFAEPARVALLRVLRYWMGYKHVVCVYSGRRGFHTWVLDEGTRTLTPAQRSVIFEKVSTPLKGTSMHDDIGAILQPFHQKYHTHYSRNVWDIFYTLDRDPTTVMNHMVGVPLVLNAHTGIVRLPIEVVSFDPATDARTCASVGYTTMHAYATHFEKRTVVGEPKDKKSKT